MKNTTTNDNPNTWNDVVAVVFWLGSAALFLSLLWMRVAESVALAAHGKAATARVIEYVPQKETHPGRLNSTVKHWHILEYDGHRKSMILDSQKNLGAEYPVLYLPENTSVMMFGDKSSTFLDLATAPAIAALILATFFAVPGILRIRKILRRIKYAADS